jgi:hypothetical protein
MFWLGVCVGFLGGGAAVTALYHIVIIPTLSGIR